MENKTTDPLRDELIEKMWNRFEEAGFYYKAFEYEMFADFALPYAREAAELRERNKWIDVNDRLPEIDVYVLWHHESGNFFIESIDKDGIFDCIKEATHWQPLPQPPTP